jgi:hypothetical protein
MHLCSSGIVICSSASLSHHNLPMSRSAEMTPPRSLSARISSQHTTRPILTSWIVETSTNPAQNRSIDEAEITEKKLVWMQTSSSSRPYLGWSYKISGCFVCFLDDLLAAYQSGILQPCLANCCWPVHPSLCSGTAPSPAFLEQERPSMGVKWT